MSPILFEPSVSSITTLLFVFASFNLDTALASPMPIAVPSLISPLAAMSVLTPFSRLSNEAWSVVIGHCVNASPANMVRPMLSLGRSAMNDAATSFAASIRLGFRSSASILVDTSMASIMSMPSTFLSSHALWVCGRAIAITIIAKATQRSIMGRCINLTLSPTGAFL